MANNFFCFQLLQLYSRRLGSFTKFTQSECAGMLMDLPTQQKQGARAAAITQMLI
ncbi:uncharacterized protein LOC115562926 isoform X2 [Drosophila navojoa]|uniref:uncharacterized protein LOC115562926 isoform X2 n=1 Tax=Drosophila navojoa TaxID=7232 RepID=UPI0011BD88D4|nr:uncharacterized protein LOC115562926 isoform X2 [Drosophila navojoa]